MNAEKRDELLLAISRDAASANTKLDQHTIQVAELFGKINDHDARINVVETRQKTCPALEREKPQSIANRIALISLIVLLLISFISIGISLWVALRSTKNHNSRFKPDTTASIERD